MKIETIAVHSGLSVDASTGAVTPPIHMATTFERGIDGNYAHGYIYGRSGNPTRDLLEQSLADLENGVSAAAFSSGMAAIMSVFQTLAPGQSVVISDDVYHGTARLLREVMASWKLETTFVDMTNIEEVERALGDNTRMIFIETPSNPLLKIVDIKAITDLASGFGIPCVCDNTWATPVLQRPLDLGVDLVVHSSTKYLGGHGDVTGGIVVAKRGDDRFKRIQDIQRNGGAIPSPFDCWLVLRGIRTLPHRMRVHVENAIKVAQFLESHSKVTHVYYPGLVAHPGHSIAVKQMRGWGGMVSFRVEGGSQAAFRVAGQAKLFTRATSLGSYESLIEHRASIEGLGTRTPSDLLRLSIGLEHHEDLIADLSQALEY